MDPPTATSSQVGSPAGHRASLPVVGGAGGAIGAAESIFAALGSPPLSGPPTGSSAAGKNEDPKREVFSDFRRLMSFGLRRDSTQPPS